MFASLKHSRLENYGVGVVIRTENSAVKLGDHVYGIYSKDLYVRSRPISTEIVSGFQEYVILPGLPDDGIWRVLENKENLPWSVYVGVAGMPGERDSIVDVLLLTGCRSNCLLWVEGIRLA